MAHQCRQMRKQFVDSEERCGGLRCGRRIVEGLGVREAFGETPHLRSRPAQFARPSQPSSESRTPRVDAVKDFMGLSGQPSLVGPITGPCRLARAIIPQNPLVDSRHCQIKLLTGTRKFSGTPAI